MSDRVRFGSWNDLITPSQSSGFNGFTYPSVFSQSTGAGTGYPVGVSLDKAIKWLWRVKEWTVAWSGSVTYSPDTGTFTTTQLTRSPVTATTELALAVQGGLTQSHSDAIAHQSATLLFSDAAINDDLAGLWFPFFNDISGFIDADDPSEALLRFSFLTDGSHVDSAVGSFDGEPITIYYFTSGTPGPDAYTVGTVTITPASFWPYAALDASPIYNTTTGAQLQSPLN